MKSRNKPPTPSPKGPPVSMLCLLASVLVVMSGPTHAQALVQSAAAPASSAPLSREQVERRLSSNTTLIEQSSASRQIDSSGNVDALDQRDRARALHLRARSALVEGDLVQANRLSDAAARTMMEAVRLASPDQINDRKDRNDFETRMNATRALIDALKRVATEKGAGARNAELVQRIEGLVGDAQKQAAAGRVPDARRLLDQAYGASRAAIGSLRGGDTLVRTLNFATKQEEYAYEIDRNDTHRMLVQVLLQDRRSVAADAMVDKALQASAQLRRQAEEQAARRDYDAGVRTLEESTRELVRAIRGAGVFIPG
ncbi:MAG: hypothetical protein IPP87_09065 [Ideonella sp.]|nr:hypothetical protein [Ideonella sp.]